MIRVFTVRHEDRRVCQLQKETDHTTERFKCGHCQKGNVVWISRAGTLTSVGNCRICEATVHWEIFQMPYTTQHVVSPEDK